MKQFHFDRTIEGHKENREKRFKEIKDRNKFGRMKENLALESIAVLAGIRIDELTKGK